MNELNAAEILGQKDSNSSTSHLLLRSHPSPRGWTARPVEELEVSMGCGEPCFRDSVRSPDAVPEGESSKPKS